MQKQYILAAIPAIIYLSYYYFKSKNQQKEEIQIVDHESEMVLLKLAQDFDKQLIATFYLTYENIKQFPQGQQQIQQNLRDFIINREKKLCMKYNITQDQYESLLNQHKNNDQIMKYYKIIQRNEYLTLNGQEPEYELSENIEKQFNLQDMIDINYITLVFQCKKFIDVFKACRTDENQKVNISDGKFLQEIAKINFSQKKADLVKDYFKDKKFEDDANRTIIILTEKFKEGNLQYSQHITKIEDIYSEIVNHLVENDIDENFVEEKFGEIKQYQL